MKNSFAAKILSIGLVTFAFSISVIAQVDVGRKTTAITYPLDDTVNVQFRGTTRFPRMKGDAKVKRTARNGTKVDLNVEKMPRPFELGAGYATYVLWAISPTGQADNLGEIKRSGTFFIDSKVSVTTPLQTFALIITAEPHFMVTRPSQTIMLENLFPVGGNGQRIGTTPSVTYFGNSSDYFKDPRTPEIAEVDYAKTPPAILQAKQAIALAKFAGADRDASTELSEAMTLLQNAERAWEAGRDADTIDISARKSISAAVNAENLSIVRKAARDKRTEQARNDSQIKAVETKFSGAQEQISNLKEELARETRNRELAERDALNYSNQVKELRAENGTLREDLTRSRIETETANNKLKAMVETAENEKKLQQQQLDSEAKAARVHADEAALINSLKTFGSVVKNEKGIVLTLPESLWSGTRSSALLPQAEGKLTSLGEILSNNPDYRVAIESHTDSSGPLAQIQTVTDKRAYTVAEKFTAMGVEEGRIMAKGYAATMPVAPNTTNANRARNRRTQVILIYYSR